MKILIIGGGGREHALAWKVAQSNQVSEVFVAPGNAGTEREPKVTNVALSADDISGLLEFAQAQHIALTIIGPELPLSLGITDRFSEAGLACFGASQAAAQLESSKTFAKDFLTRHNIPTARYQSFSALEAAQEYIHELGAPLVIKADGLAAGKGVILAQTIEEALRAVQGMLSGKDFGKAGQRVVIEEFLYGEEASFIVMTDGKTILPLATSQDHKARDNGDQGPNTGGMGAYSPAPVVTAELHARIMAEIIEPTVRGMAAEGHPYLGFLYAGLMINADGPKVLEYNCRLGDPETQPLLLRLRSDLVELCEAALKQELHTLQADWDPRPALGVVMAAAGYPDDYKQGDIIHGLPSAEQELSAEAKVFHAGTATNKSGAVVTQGGRVLCATALGTNIADAQKQAYNLAKLVHWDGVYYRTDIGYRAIAQLVN